MSSSRRVILENIDITTLKGHTNPGLWWDKYPKIEIAAQESSKKGQAKTAHIKALEDKSIPCGYKKAFDRWKGSFSKDPSCLLAKATAQRRMIIGIGEKGLLEVGMRMHHTWGIPLIPGSALKGLAAATAHTLSTDPAWKKSLGDSSETKKIGSLHKFLFGDLDQSGAIEFLDAWWDPYKKPDAWWDPRKELKIPIFPDIMTVHHKEYYESSFDSAQEGPAPSDTDSPVPISFASTSGIFLIIIRIRNAIREQIGNDETCKKWLSQAMEILKLGLERFGIGAKTSTGYGRMKLEVLKPEKIKRPPQEQWVIDHKKDIEGSPEEQARWLRENAKKSKIPPDFSDDPISFKKLLKEHLAKGIQELEKDNLENWERELLELKEELKKIEQSPPKTSKEKKRWKKDRNRLKKRIQQEEQPPKRLEDNLRALHFLEVEES